MAAGLMTMKGELIDREHVDVDSRLERGRALRRRSTTIVAGAARAGPRPTTARARRRRRRLRRTGATECRGGLAAEHRRVAVSSRCASSWRLRPASTCTAISTPRRSPWPRVGWARRMGTPELPGDGRVDRRRRGHRAERAAARRRHRQRRPHRPRRSSSRTGAAARAGRVAASRRRRRARRSRRSPGARHRSRPTRSCSAPAAWSGAPWRRCATCSTSTSPSSAARSRSGFGATFFNSAQETLDEHAQLSFSRSARITPARLGDRGPLIGAGAVGVRGLRRAGRPRE